MSMEQEYTLTEDDLERTDTRELPVARAARNPSLAVLRAILDYGGGTRYGFTAGDFVAERLGSGCNSGLTAAVAAQLPQNVALLLERGSDPVPYSTDVMAEYAIEFLRFRNSQEDDHLTGTELDQAGPVTADELADRALEIQPFWMGADFEPTDVWPGGDGMTALETACKGESLQIFDLIWNARPDVSFWLEGAPIPPASQSTSSLSVSNPFLGAIKNRRTAMVKRLLELGFNPNTMPLTIRQQCFTPLMATLMLCDPPNWDAYNLLLASPYMRRDTLTPVYKIHFMHIAVAQVSIDILERVLADGFSLRGIGPTAAQHTLLHIACLPETAHDLCVFSKAVCESCHDCRRLGRFPEDLILIDDQGLPEPARNDYHDSQLQIVRLILSQADDAVQLVQARDTHMNTALHYLACHRTPNQPLIDFLIAYTPEAAETWNTARNSWGWTPKDLWNDGLQAAVERIKPFWDELPFTCKLVPGHPLRVPNCE